MAGLDRLVADIAGKTPALKRIDPSRILFIAADARHASRATTRPTRYAGGTKTSPDGVWERPSTIWKGKDMLYIVELRPKFFRDSTAESRLQTIIHEMFHMGDPFDGSIPDSQSHRLGADFDAQVEAMAAGYAATADPAILRPLALDGEVTVRQWLERPKNRVRASDLRTKRSYGAKDIFTGPVEMITRDSPLKRRLNPADVIPAKAGIQH
jgi:hypothetical protein